MAASRLRNPRGVCAAAADSRERNCACPLARSTRSRVAARIWSRVVMGGRFKYMALPEESERGKAAGSAKIRNGTEIKLRPFRTKAFPWRPYVSVKQKLITRRGFWNDLQSQFRRFLWRPALGGSFRPCGIIYAHRPMYVHRNHKRHLCR